MQGAQGATLTMVMAWRLAAEGNKQQTCERALPEIRASDPLLSPILPSFMKRQMTGCCYIPLCQVRASKTRPVRGKMVSHEEVLTRPNRT
jgi:hypothetical protein